MTRHLDECPKCGMVGACWCPRPEDGKAITCRRCGTVIAYGDESGTIRPVEVLVNGQPQEDFGCLKEWKKDPWHLPLHMTEVNRRRGIPLAHHEDSTIVCYNCGKKRTFYGVKIAN
jgi:ribosomal protein S27AE